MENQERIISITDLLKILKKYLLAIIVATAISTVIAYVYCNYFVEKLYSATAVFYLENKNTTNENRPISTEDINSAQRLVQNAITVLKSMDSIPSRVIEQHNLYGYSPESFKNNAIKITGESGTTVLSITITLKEKDLVVPVLKSYSELCIAEFERIINSGSIKVVNEATSTGRPIYPVPMNFLIGGFLIGLIGSYLIVLMREMLDVKIKSEDDLFMVYNIPVFAEILSFNSKSKADYSNYSYE